MQRLTQLLFALGAASILTVAAVSARQSDNVGDSVIRNTVRLSLIWYAVAAILMLHLRPEEWTAAHGRGRVARSVWTWAWIVYLLHLVAAFHFAHGWSHDHAVAHTRERSGVGEGIYASHLFTLLWTLDVAWWHLRPLTYAQRPPWFDRVLHGFMVFIIFNGTVVYESGPIRWVSLVGFLVLSVEVLRRSRGEARTSPTAPAANGGPTTDANHALVTCLPGASPCRLADPPELRPDR